MISRAALKILMAAMYKMPVMLMSIFIFCLSTTYGLRNPLICDPRLVIPQCQYPTVCDRQRYHNQCQYRTVCHRRLVIGHCQYHRACYCDQRLRFGWRRPNLFFYNKRTNRCERNAEILNCNAFASKPLCETTCVLPDAAR
ncbi:uncharacterized protein LOC119186173 isoform X1 [Rhipicephalus microplus]|uniref:uncharacterized protein LOC119186173 isoform X1 n=1 Tax=Rhipicephalus microplus TaxID=6941 RepID=UPI003F6BA9C5